MSSDHAFGRETSQPPTDAGDINLNIIPAADRPPERGCLPLQCKDHHDRIHVSCHFNIFKLSPSRAFIPRAAATS